MKDVARSLASAGMDRLRALVGERLQYRRDHPYETYLFHKYLADLHRKNGRRFLAWVHRQYRSRWWARAMATAEAHECRCLDCGEVL